jgi:hypothetical protein
MKTDAVSVTAKVLADWPFLIEFDCAKVRPIVGPVWARPAYGLCSPHQFELQRLHEVHSLPVVPWERCICRRSRTVLAVRGCRIRRPVLDCVQVSCCRAWPADALDRRGAAHLPAQAVELYLDIDLAANYGLYDSQGRVSWAGATTPVRPVGEGNGLDVVPYRVYFSGLPAVDKFIDLGDLRSESDVVLKPMEFVLRCR